VVIIADRQPKTGDSRPIQVEAIEWIAALRRIGGTQLVAIERIGSPKFIHQAGGENAGHTQICLIRIVAARSPGGFQISAAREVGVPILAVAEVDVVLVVELVIQPSVEQLASEGQVPDVAETGPDRVGKTDRLSAHLVSVLEIGKEKEAVFF